MGESSADKISQGFVTFLLSTKIALITFVLSSFMGFGLSFIIFDYRVKNVFGWLHVPFHCIIGVAYTALIFIACNLDIFSRMLEPTKIMERMPFTLVVSLALGFVILVAGAIFKEVKKPLDR